MNINNISHSSNLLLLWDVLEYSSLFSYEGGIFVIEYKTEYKYHWVISSLIMLKHI